MLIFRKLNFRSSYTKYTSLCDTPISTTIYVINVTFIFHFFSSSLEESQLERIPDVPPIVSQTSIIVNHNNGQVIVNQMSFPCGAQGVRVEIRSKIGNFQRLGFVVDHIENLITDWYPGKLMLAILCFFKMFHGISKQCSMTVIRNWAKVSAVRVYLICSVEFPNLTTLMVTFLWYAFLPYNL